MALLNSLIDVQKKEKPVNFSVTMIHYTKLVPSENNNYSTDNIAELANIILLSGGVKENLMARRKAPGEYELISGHRRRLAVKYITETLQIPGYELVPVHVEDEGEIISEVNLLLMNCASRERTDWEKMMEITRLSELMLAMQSGNQEEQERFRRLFNRDPGLMSARDLRKAVAESLGLSETKVANLTHINKKLIPELKDRMKTGGLGVSAANEAAGLPPEKQMELSAKEDISLSDVQEMKAVSESDTGDGQMMGQTVMADIETSELGAWQQEPACEADKIDTVLKSVSDSDTAGGTEETPAQRKIDTVLKSVSDSDTAAGTEELSAQMKIDTVLKSVSDSDTAAGTEELSTQRKIDTVLKSVSDSDTAGESEESPDPDEEDRQQELNLDSYDRDIMMNMIKDQESALQLMEDHWKANQPQTYIKYAMQLTAYRMLYTMHEEEVSHGREDGQGI